MSTDNLLAAMPRRRFLISPWPWRSFAYVATTVPVAAVAAVGLSVVALPWLAAGRMVVDGRPLNVGILFFVAMSAALAVVVGPPASIALAAFERSRLRIVDLRPISSGHRMARDSPGQWLRIRFTEAATWRELAYAAFLAAVVPVAYGALVMLVVLDLALALSPWFINHDGGPISIGFSQVTSVAQAVPYAVVGFLFLPALPYLLGLVGAGQTAVARALLGGGDLAAVREVARSRSRLVDTYEAQRRRLERDLHDVAQHRLTSVTLQLGMARLDVPDDSPAAPPLDRAHEQAKELMVFLRDLIHGIHPQSLTDLGLVGAVRELAAGLPIPTTVTADQPWDRPLSDQVESTAYFVASETLANIARHSNASRAEVAFTRTADALIMEIRDDGHGGANPALGTGLTGLADRVAAVNGRLSLGSPAGGPTLVRMELPCDQ